MPTKDVAIAGAGIIGLSAALELALAGAHVTVFERGLAMHESSWAAAGMLAPIDPGNPPELRALSAFSFQLYPEFLTTIERLSGKHVPILATKTLEGVQELPPNAHQLSAETIQALAPGLQVSGLKFYLLEEMCFDPRALGEALILAVKQAGVTLLEQTAVLAVESRSDAIHIHTTAGDFVANEFINACGAWASDLSGIPIAPRKGQLLLTQHPHLYADQHLTAVIRIPRLYLIPRPQQCVLIGSTIEDTGFDQSVDSTTIASLHARAAELWPPEQDAQIIDSWAGLRPASPDSLPVIGAKEPHHWLALGHFRNGILLAPGTARLLRQMVLNEPLSADLHHFAPQRFGATHA
ncbi:MAG TPA: FAD-dependent oxidoreductase [Acidobacteriaceae bacterium]|nr:FAD-dependent oxidoreductase [Acidobacteriaceae bacterium]